MPSFFDNTKTIYHYNGKPCIKLASYTSNSSIFVSDILIITKNKQQHNILITKLGIHDHLIQPFLNLIYYSKSSIPYNVQIIDHYYHTKDKKYKCDLYILNKVNNKTLLGIELNHLFHNYYNN